MPNGGAYLSLKEPGLGEVGWAGAGFLISDCDPARREVTAPEARTAPDSPATFKNSRLDSFLFISINDSPQYFFLNVLLRSFYEKYH
jgi:hypothetical protein